MMKEQTELEKIWSTRFNTFGVDFGSLKCKGTDGKSLLIKCSYGDYSITITDEANGTYEQISGEKVGFCFAEGNFVCVPVSKNIYVERVIVKQIEKLTFEIEEGSWS